MAFGDRRKPLKRDGPGARKFANLRSEIKRQPVLPDRNRTVADRKPRRAAPDPVTPAVRAAVRDRSGGMCEARASSRCDGVACHVHHRQLRRHGNHTPTNLLHVCTACHDAIHGPLAASGVSYLRRWLLHTWEDPEEFPVS